MDVSWTIKKAERRRIDAFDPWCWRRLLRVSWTARRSNQSILQEVSPGCSLEGLMLKLKCQYFGHLMWRADSLENTLMLGKIEGRRRWGRRKMRWYHRLDGHGFGWTLGIGDGQEGLACYASWGRTESDTTEWLSWTELNRGGFVRFVQIGCWEHRSGRIKDAFRSLEVLDTEGRAEPFLHWRQGWLVGEELLKHPDGEWMPPGSSDWSHLPKINNWQCGRSLMSFKGMILVKVGELKPGRDSLHNPIYTSKWPVDLKTKLEWGSWKSSISTSVDSESQSPDSCII